MMKTHHRKPERSDRTLGNTKANHGTRRARRGKIGDSTFLATWHLSVAERAGVQRRAERAKVKIPNWHVRSPDRVPVLAREWAPQQAPMRVFAGENWSGRRDSNPFSGPPYLPPVAPVFHRMLYPKRLRTIHPGARLERVSIRGSRTRTRTRTPIGNGLECRTGRFSSGF
jgi:hypothetical protein